MLPFLMKLSVLGHRMNFSVLCVRKKELKIFLTVNLNI